MARRCSRKNYVIDYVRVYQVAENIAPPNLVFDDMEHGDPFANGWFVFNGPSVAVARAQFIRPATGQWRGLIQAAWVGNPVTSVASADLPD